MTPMWNPRLMQPQPMERMANPFQVAAAPNPFAAPVAQAQAAPQPQTGFGGLGNFLSDNSGGLIALGAGMLTGQTGAGLNAFGQQLGQNRQRSKTLAWLKQNRPEYADAYAAGVLDPKTIGSLMFGKAELPDAVQKYQFAQRQGFTGSYLDFEKALREAGATNIDLAGGPELGKLSTDYGYVLDPQTGKPVIDPNTGLPKSAAIPGSPAAQAQEQDRMRADQRSVENVAKAGPVISDVRSAKEILKRSGSKAAGTFSRPYAVVSGSDAGRLRSYLSHLQSSQAIGTMMKLKELSATGATGFGQLNKAELQLLLDSVGAINPDTTEPDILLQTLDRIEKHWTRVVEDIKRNVSPERIRELGLDELIGDIGIDGNANDPLGIR